jgi:beta-galactosidase
MNTLDTGRAEIGHVPVRIWNGGRKGTAMKGMELGKRATQPQASQPRTAGKKIMHGADYYPEQWLDTPEILEEDLRMMKLAHIDTVTLGVFAWAALEPEEGFWRFEWLDRVMDRLHENGIQVILATPSGARPAWLAKAYPEVLRVTQDRQRNLYGMRMNHCYTSPRYRELTKRIDSKLAGRYAKHPALKAWHISNEYHGECHCGLCQEAFRRFLQEKYGSLEKLNQAWWTAFWSKTYTDWEQVESPSSRGEMAVQGLALDWKRFVTAQTKAFMDMEIGAVKAYTPDIPVTTNMIGSFIEVDYPRLAPSLDVASMDLYPQWGSASCREVAMDAGFEYDVIRCLKMTPFWLMETTPSMTSWTEVGKLKEPGLHRAGCLQAVAHGADSVQYFQWRKSRGAFEKFHGAIIGHSGHEHTRVFRETAQLGEILGKLGEVAGTRCRGEAAVLYDWSNRWAIEGSMGPRKNKYYEETVREHYRALRSLGLNVDVIEEGQPLEDYAIVAAPMLYLVKVGLAEALEAYVEKGGILLLTYFSGIVDENDLCFQGGFPGPLRKLAGVWVEELDTLYPEEQGRIVSMPENSIKIHGIWTSRDYIEVIHPETAAVEAVHGTSWYQGMPALTSNKWEAGSVWYLAARAEEAFLKILYGKLLSMAAKRKKAQAGPVRQRKLPEEVELSIRRDGTYQYFFYINWGRRECTVKAPEGVELTGGHECRGELVLEPLGTAVVKAAYTERCS